MSNHARRFDVLSLGRLAVDLYANEIGVELRYVKSFNVYAGGCPTNIAAGTRRSDVLSLGRLAVDLYANEIGVELRYVKSFNVDAGGCPTNIAAGTRRLRLRVAVCNRVGTDGLSDGLLDFLAAEGVNKDSIARDPHHLPGLTFLSIVPPDKFPLVYFRPDPADMHLSLDDIQGVPIEDSRVLLTAGTRFSGDPSRATTFKAMERARAAGTTVWGVFSQLSGWVCL